MRLVECAAYHELCTAITQQKGGNCAKTKKKLING